MLYYPNGPLPLGSPYYIERSPLEEQVYQEIKKPGALVRIKAPKEMGKTSLLLRILDFAQNQGYPTVQLNLEQIEPTILSNLEEFVRWLCANVARQLQLEPMLEEYWDDDLGGKISSTSYMEDYLLDSIDTPFVLALDEVNQLFDYPQVAKDFLPLLRSWYEEAKTRPIWRKLRLIVIHSTEIYVSFPLNQSPFNVGLPVQLTPFSLDEVLQLSQRYKLSWLDDQAAKQLMNLIEGHPALVQIALYHLSCGEITLEQLLETAPTIYHHHLEKHLLALEKQPELLEALDTVMTANNAVELDDILAYKLSGLGLIKHSAKQAMPSCELYRQYFQNRSASF